FGGLYFASPDKLDPRVPFVKKEVRQAMNLAINRQAIAQALLGGRVEPLRVHGYHPQLDSAIWPGIWNLDWDRRFEALYGYDPARARALLAQAGYPNGFEFTIVPLHAAGVPRDGRYRAGHDAGFPGSRTQAAADGNRFPPGAGALPDQDDPRGGVSRTPRLAGPGSHSPGQ